MLGPLGTISAAWGAKGTAEGTPWRLESDFHDLIDFGLGVFPTLWSIICVLFIVLVCSFFQQFSDLNLVMAEFEKQVFRMRACAKNDFSQLSGY